MVRWLFDTRIDRYGPEDFGGCSGCAVIVFSMALYAMIIGAVLVAVAVDYVRHG